MKRVLLILIVFIGLTACADRIKQEDLIGKYGYSEGGDTIVINADGSYHHYLTRRTGQRLENRGTWKYDSESNEVLFEKFSFFTENSPAGNWFSRIRAKDGEIDLMYSSENNIYYRKQDSIKR